MTIIEEAQQIIKGERREAYGPVEESFTRIAEIWTAILNHPISQVQVAEMMIGLKLHREANRHSRDNLVDIIGYTLLLSQLNDGLQEDKEKTS